MIDLESSHVRLGVMTRSVYLDGHATTPMAPEVQAVMGPLWHSAAANVDSPHAMGMKMSAAVETARAEIATLIGSAPQEVVFTSGATEANNLALIGVAKAALAGCSPRRRIIMSAIEHKSVLAVSSELVRMGFEVLSIPAGPSGMIDLGKASSLITTETLLVSAMLVNNETGLAQPIAELAVIARRVGAIVHSDAAQACGRVSVDVLDLDLDLMSISSHKMYGPVGIGALFISGAAQLRPLPITFGGGQEGGLRSGTLPGPLIVGFGKAATIAHTRITSDAVHVTALADQFLNRLRERQVRFSQIGEPSARIAGSLCLAFENVEADDLIAAVSPDVCISSGSACSSGQIISSHVLRAMNVSSADIESVIRVYCGRYNTSSEINLAAEIIADHARRLATPTGRVRQ